jgi:hypothetical protein
VVRRVPKLTPEAQQDGARRAPGRDVPEGENGGAPGAVRRDGSA